MSDPNQPQYPGQPGQPVQPVQPLPQQAQPQPAYQPPPGYPPPGTSGPPASPAYRAPRSPDQERRLYGTIVLIAGWIAAGAAVLAAILFLAESGGDGTAKI